MSYLERKQINKKTYTYFVKKISFMKNIHIIKKHIGIDSQAITKEKYLLDNFEYLSNEEFNFRKKFLRQIKEKVSHNEHLPEKIEIKAIEINNLSEGKKRHEFLDIESAKEFIFNSNNIEGSKIPPEKVREIIDSGETKYQNKNEIKENTTKAETDH